MFGVDESLIRLYGRTREERDSIFRTQDSLIELAQLRDARQVWIRRHFVRRPDEDAGCCECSTRDIDNDVLRFRTHPMPAAVAEFLGSGAREEWGAFSADLDAALRLRQPCVSKGCSIAVFILLFYTTIIGIFFHMCCEAYCGRRGRVGSRRALAAALEKWARRWQERGISVEGRWHPDRPAGEDAPDDGSQDERDWPFIVLTLPRAPTSAAAVNGAHAQAQAQAMLAQMSPQQLAQMQALVQQQLAAAQSRAPALAAGQPQAPMAQAQAAYYVPQQAQGMQVAQSAQGVQGVQFAAVAYAPQQAYFAPQQYYSQAPMAMPQAPLPSAPPQGMAPPQQFNGQGVAGSQFAPKGYSSPRDDPDPM